MRRHKFDRQAVEDLNAQVDYLTSKDAFGAAERLQARVLQFVERLCDHPAMGRFLEHRGLWELWIPNTRLVLWYRYNDEHLEVVRVWHTSRDRERAPDDRSPGLNET